MLVGQMQPACRIFQNQAAAMCVVTCRRLKAVGYSTISEYHLMCGQVRCRHGYTFCNAWDTGCVTG